MRVINLYGGPGAGKSTSAAGLFYLMKINGHKVELVTEYAKDLVYSNRLDDMLDQQEYIFDKQNHRLHVLRDKVDYAITDSPLLLSCIYVNHDEWPASNEFIDFVVAVNNTYDNVNFFIERPNTYQEYGRKHSLDESVEIDNKIKQGLKEYSTTGVIGIPANAHTVLDIYRLITGVDPSVQL